MRPVARLACSIAALLVVGLLAAGCSSTPPNPEERAREAVGLYKEGVAKFNSGDIDGGISNLKQANEIQPGYTLLRYDLGRMLLVRAERTDTQSLRAADEARRLRQDKKVSEAKEKESDSLGLNRRAQTDLRDSLQHFLWVEQTWPHEANVPYFLAIVYTGLGDFDEARDRLERALELGEPTGKHKEKLERAVQLLEEAEIQKQRLSER